MIDTSHTNENDQPIPLSVAAREVPNRTGGRGVNVATPWRWALKGVRGIRLRTEMVGGTRMTRRSWVEEFHAAVTAASNIAPVVQVRTPHQRQKAIDAAKERLAAAGI